MKHTYFLILCILIILSACAENVKDISRVQPHALEKEKLKGQWYARQTLAQRPGEFAFLFTGIEGSLEKIEWEIRQDQLIARRVYEAVPQLDEQTRLAGGELKGSPVAIFPIISHFDIIRDYQPTTGNQSNVIREDVSLHPWYERKYIRVDWTKNLIQSPIDLSGILQINPYTNTPTKSQWIRETDPSNPDHWQINDDFIFITAKYALFDGGYSCYSNFVQATSLASPCGSVELSVRHAFHKIKESDMDFEAVPYLDRELIKDEQGNALKYTKITTGLNRDQTIDVLCTPEILEKYPEINIDDCQSVQWDQQNRFGYFRSERIKYDQQIGGGNDLNREFYANHHNIWKNSINAQGQLIPKEQRELRPVVYYLNANFPDDLKTTAVKIARAWNKVLLQSAMLATQKSESEIQQQLKRDFDASAQFAVFLRGEEGAEHGSDQLFQIRDNQCSQAGIEQYLLMYPEYASVLGDRYTEGQKIDPLLLEESCSLLTHASRELGDQAFVWQQIGDIRFNFLYWIHDAQPSGPLGFGPSGADIENGRIVSGNAYIYGAALDSYARSGADMVRAMNGNLCEAFGLPTDDFSCALEGDDLKVWLEKGSQATQNLPLINATLQQEISQRLNLVDLSHHNNQANSLPSSSSQANLITEAERDLKRRLNQPNLHDPLSNILAQSPLSRMQIKEKLIQNPDILSKLLSSELTDLFRPLWGLDQNASLNEEQIELAVDMLIDPESFRQKRDQQKAFFESKNVYLGEELDDSIIGQARLLKDLEPEEIYQILRREIFEAVSLHEIGHTMGLRHNFKASFDALNYQDEFWDIVVNQPEDRWAEERLPEYRYASIMDYGARFNSDTKGLGKYDQAAIHFVYAGYVEVFTDAVTVPGSLELLLEYNDYRKIPSLLGDVTALTQRQYLKKEDLIAQKKAGLLQNTQAIAQNRDSNLDRFWVDRVVPYHFCSDEFRGDLKCRTWDEGANHTEAVKSALDLYWVYFYLDTYRRGRNQNAFVNRVFGRMDRVSEYLRYPWQFYVFYDQYQLDLRDDLLQASLLGLNFMNQVLGTPEPGYYCNYRSKNFYIPRGYYSDLPDQEFCDPFYIPYGQGRNSYLDFSNEHLYQIDYIGTYYDKINLLTNLINTNTRFFRLRDLSSQRPFAINYYLGFKKEMLQIFRDMLFSTLPIYQKSAISPEISANQKGHFNYIKTDTGLMPQPFYRPNGEEPSDHQVFTYIPYNLVWQTLALSTIFASSRLDDQMDFVDYIAIHEEGSGDARTFAPGTPIATFHDPQTKQIYYAAQTPDLLSISYEYLTYIEDFRVNQWQPAYDQLQRYPNDENYNRNFYLVNRVMQGYIDLIDDLRQIRSLGDWAR